MTLTELVWKIERFLIKAKCSKCYFYKSDLCLCNMFHVKISKDCNCMYYDKSLVKRK